MTCVTTKQVNFLPGVLDHCVVGHAALIGWFQFFVRHWKYFPTRCKLEGTVFLLWLVDFLNSEHFMKDLQNDKLEGAGRVPWGQQSHLTLEIYGSSERKLGIGVGVIQIRLETLRAPITFWELLWSVPLCLYFHSSLGYLLLETELGVFKGNG